MTASKTSSSTGAKPARKPAASTAGRAGAAKSKPRQTSPKAKPHGKEEVVDSIIDATISLWTAKGPAELSLRSIAARAGVNYGLVYRHFGTKEAVIRAAMDRVVARSLTFVEDSDDLVDALDRVMPPSTGAHARLLAWAILQYVVDDVLPEDDAFLARLVALASEDSGTAGRADNETKVKVGSMLAMLYGWRLFQPYLVRGLGLEKLSHAKLDKLVRDRMLKMMAD